MKLSEEQQQELSQLYQENFVPLFYYATSTLQDRDAAEDAVQETFQIACRRFDVLFSNDNPSGWLMNTLKNVLRNRKRLLRRLFRVFSPLPLDDKLDLQADPPGELDIVIRSLLTEEEYSLYRMVIVGGETIPNAAKKHGITTEACKKRVQRIRARLREGLKDSSER